MTVDIELPDGNTVYEKAKIIGSRALQLAQGAPILIDLDDDELEELQYDPVKIAKLEYESGELPLKAERVLPSDDNTMF